eukprot:TRINITY_DN32520_c0_g1_i2.p1 TRINITY_DN32520_c0_g1~~TRINITY_DN32520_c0_g1_i2.p1  ORF type:complete len:222 (-),score=26.45 TRINITY_DN32520_c0_g1_i2:249-914(-)
MSIGIILKKLGVAEPSISSEVIEFSSQYRKPKTTIEIEENSLDEVFTSGKVSNVSVCFKSTQKSKNVKVSGYVHVQNLHATNEGNGVKYLRLLPQTTGTRIIFEDCKFEGIGLIVGPYEGDKVSRGHVSIKNCEIKDAPGYGISIEYCVNCKAENVKIDGCHDGPGINFCQTDGETKNSSISNYSEQGVYVGNATVKGHQVQFYNNKEGNTKGNYVEVQEI